MVNRKLPKLGARARLALASIAAMASVSIALVQYIETRPALRPRRPVPSVGALNLLKTDDGRQLLWAKGPRDKEAGEWFDITDSPLKSDGYQFGIGKDSIPAIDRPAFVAIDEIDKLRERGIDDETAVIGYVHNGQAKAYPLTILHRHELVNDDVGGKPVTVGW